MKKILVKIPQILLCGWSIGLGLRLSLVKLLNPDKTVIYIMNIFDAYFDWLGLLILGLINLLIIIVDTYRCLNANNQI